MDLGNDQMHERLGAVLEPVHDELVERLAPQPGERWLDLGSGTGVGRAARRPRGRRGDGDRQRRAARSSKAREDAEAEGLGDPLRHRQRRVPALRGRRVRRASPRPSASSSPPTTRTSPASSPGSRGRGGRLGFTAWKPNPKLGELYRRFTEEPLEGREATEWGREDHVEDMLGEDFELEFVDGTLWIDADSGEELWELFSTLVAARARAPAQARRRARRGVPPGVRRAVRELPRGRPHPGAAPLPARRSAGAASAARLGRARAPRTRTARSSRSRSTCERGFWGRDGLVADLYLGYGLSAALRREPAPRAARAVPAAAPRLPRSGRRPRRARVTTVGASPRRVGAQLGRRRLRRRDRGRCARRSRAATSTRRTSSSTSRRRSRGDAGGAGGRRSRRSVRSQPRPFAGAGWAIVSASPELFLARRGRRLVDRRRSRARVRPGSTSRARRTSAEHVMIVDLERNDLARVCEPGQRSTGPS